MVGGQKVDITRLAGRGRAVVDKDWARFKVTRLLRLGRRRPAWTSKATGFDTIYDNSNFAGGPFSFWSRSGIALTQTEVLLKAPGQPAAQPALATSSRARRTS